MNNWYLRGKRFAKIDTFPFTVYTLKRPAAPAKAASVQELSEDDYDFDAPPPAPKAKAKAAPKPIARKPAASKASGSAPKPKLVKKKVVSDSEEEDS